VNLRVRIDDEGIALDVVDDGVGFDPDTATPGHLGLQSLKERSRLLGGVVAIHSSPGSGTRIMVRVPPSIDR
jgi:signal transduction histidine kinase